MYDLSHVGSRKRFRNAAILGTALLATAGGFFAGREYERSNAPTSAPPTVRFENEYMIADVYVSQNLIGRHPLDEVEKNVFVALTGANVNLLMEGPAYELMKAFDYACHEEKTRFLEELNEAFGSSSVPKGPAS